MESDVFPIVPVVGCANAIVPNGGIGTLPGSGQVVGEISAVVFVLGLDATGEK